jgi:hypothetical protein
MNNKRKMKKKTQNILNLNKKKKKDRLTDLLRIPQVQKAKGI